LHHPHAFVPKLATGVDTPHRILVLMGELSFDRIGVEEPGRVQERVGHRAKAVRGYLVRAIAQCAQHRVDHVLGLHQASRIG